MFGRSLLWQIFDPEERSKVPAFITNRVMEAYDGLLNYRSDGEVNPVQNVPLMVTVYDAELFIDLLMDDVGG